MKFTTNINKALAFSAAKHLGQTRKDKEETPYIMHPVAVAIILSQYTQDEDVIIAGLLHDTLEDCAVTTEELQEKFGKRVSEIVMEVTEDVELKKTGEKESWKQRKTQYLENLANDSKEGMMVCAADKIHNLISMHEAYKVENEAIWEHFNATPEMILWFNVEILKLLQGMVPGEMLREYERVLEELRSVLPKIR